MKCKDIKEFFDDYLNENLSSHMKSKIDEHINSCKNCADDFAFFKKYFSALDSAAKSKNKKYLSPMNITPVIKAPENFLQEIHHRVENPFSSLVKKIFFPQMVKLSLKGASLCTVIVIALIFYPWQSSSPLINAEKEAISFSESEMLIADNEELLSMDKSVVKTEKKRRITSSTGAGRQSISKKRRVVQKKRSSKRVVALKESEPPAVLEKSSNSMSKKIQPMRKMERSLAPQTSSVMSVKSLDRADNHNRVEQSIAVSGLSSSEVEEIFVKFSAKTISVRKYAEAKKISYLIQVSSENFKPLLIQLAVDPQKVDDSLKERSGVLQFRVDVGE